VPRSQRVLPMNHPGVMRPAPDYTGPLTSWRPWTREEMAAAEDDVDPLQGLAGILGKASRQKEIFVQTGSLSVALFHC
jgi:hypothetical protein